VRSLSISQKLIISLILISLLPYALISYVNYSAEEKALEKKILDDLSALAEAKNTHISTVINFRIEQANEIASSNFMQEIGSNNTSNLNFNIERVKKEIPVFLEITVIDRDGIVVASTDRMLINSNFSEKERFSKAKEKLYLGDLEYYDNRTGFIISSPVYDRSTGEFKGVITFRIYPRLIYDVTSDYTGMGETGESLLVRKQGNEVVFLNPLRHNASPALSMRFPIDSYIAAPAIHAVKGEKGTLRGLDYRGKDVFAAYTYNPVINWGVVVKIDSSEALIPVTDLFHCALIPGVPYQQENHRSPHKALGRLEKSGKRLPYNPDRT
jgi:Cache domain